MTGKSNFFLPFNYIKQVKIATSLLVFRCYCNSVVLATPFI